MKTEENRILSTLKGMTDISHWIPVKTTWCVVFIPMAKISAPEVNTTSAASGSPNICYNMCARQKSVTKLIITCSEIVLFWRSAGKDTATLDLCCHFHSKCLGNNSIILQKKSVVLFGYPGSMELAWLISFSL